MKAAGSVMGITCSSCEGWGALQAPWKESAPGLTRTGRVIRVRVYPKSSTRFLDICSAEE